MLPAPVQILIAILSVPVIVTVLTSFVIWLSPTRRWSAQLTRDLAIYEKLPDGKAKDGLGAHIEALTTRLNEYRINNSGRVIALRVIGIIVLVILTVVAFFVARAFIGTGADWEAISSLIATGIGAVGSIFALSVSTYAANQGRLKALEAERALYEAALLRAERNRRVHSGDERAEG